MLGAPAAAALAMPEIGVDLPLGEACAGIASASDDPPPEEG